LAGVKTSWESERREKHETPKERENPGEKDAVTTQAGKIVPLTHKGEHRGGLLN